MLSAKDARKALDKKIEDALNKEIGRIEEQIYLAVSRNSCSLQLDKISVEAKEVLEKNGYKVSHFSDQRDSVDYYSVSW